MAVVFAARQLIHRYDGEEGGRGKSEESWKGAGQKVWVIRPTEEEEGGEKGGGREGEERGEKGRQREITTTRFHRSCRQYKGMIFSMLCILDY
jgi:hypothetical protein